MRHTTILSELFDGCGCTLFYVEGSDKRINEFMRGNGKAILQKSRPNGYEFKIVGKALFGRRSLKNLILRNEPTLNADELRLRVAAHKAGGEHRHGALCCVTENYEILTQTILPTAGNGSEEAILQEQIEKFLNNTAKSTGSEPPTRMGRVRYKKTSDTQPFLSTDEIKEQQEILGTEILAAGIHPADKPQISPLHIDAGFNISLPLYPQISIKMNPLHKSIYILFLLHPEGIILKELVDYQEELKKIYCTVSGRKNESVIRRLLKQMTDPTDNLPHKAMSIIRRTFLGQLRADIAEQYIPTHGRYVAHRIPIERSMVTFDGIF